MESASSPAISVVISCFNYGRFLRDAVHSLIGGETSLGTFPPQTFTDFEIIIVDDASTDETLRVAAELVAKSEEIPIRYFHHYKNMGSAVAMNTGIRESKGTWLAPLDADDMMESTRLETLYRTAQANPHSVIYDEILAFAPDRAALEQFYPDVSAITPRGRQWVTVRHLPPYDFEKILTHNGIHKGIFFERSAWETIGGYPESFNDGREDWAVNVALGTKGYCGIHVREPLYLARRHESNRTNTNGMREYRQYFIDKMRAQYPNLYRGERPMGCCGKGNRNGNGNGDSGTLGLNSQAGTLSAGRFSLMGDTGQEGMVRVEYLLNKAGTIPYTVNNRTYVFGGDRRIGYVDARDVDGLLAMVEARHPVFQIYQEPVAQPSGVAPTSDSEAARMDELMDRRGVEAFGGASGDVVTMDTLSANAGSALPAEPIADPRDIDAFKVAKHPRKTAAKKAGARGKAK